MLKKILLLGLLVPFVLSAEETSTVPSVTAPAVPVAKTATTPEAEKIDQKKIAQDKIEKDEKNPARKSVAAMLDGFTKMSDNRQKYLDGHQTKEQYMQKDNKISDEISSHIDFWDVCEKSLKYDYNPKQKKFRKDHWAGKSQEEKTSFAKLFSQLIEEIVYPIANEYFNDLTMKHSVVESKKDMVYIKTIVTNSKKRKNREFIMEWFLHPSSKGGWTVYDVGVEGERWVEGFRSQFNDVITKKSYKELINMMHKKLKDVKEDRATKDAKDLEKAKELEKAKKAVDAEKKEPVKEDVKK